MDHTKQDVQDQPATSQAIIVRELEAMPVGQRASDGYINATAMCQVAGKLVADYLRLQVSTEFLEELWSDMGIPISLLVQSVRGGKIENRGTWVHPLVAVNLAQWCSPKFAVQVSKWVAEWAVTGRNPLRKMSPTYFYDNANLQKGMSQVYHHHLSRTSGNYVHNNAELCVVHSDWRWYPKQYIEWARIHGWPSKQRTSGLEVLRHKEPASAAAIATEKWAICGGAAPEKARKIAAYFKTGFQMCLDAGLMTGEMQEVADDPSQL